jgi:hypothetical protein
LSISRSILTTCPSYSSLPTLSTVTISGDLNLLHISLFVFILRHPFSYVCSYIFPKSFLSHAS